MRAVFDKVAGRGPACKPAAARIPGFPSDSTPVIPVTFPHSKHIDAMRAMLDDTDSSRPANRTDTANRLAQPDIGDGLNPFPIRCDTS
ncbi:hypothetical protein THIOKS13210010 [Thiocapsa sp. KS1]|nr:hypothetical protein [Thiocapsa sp. KS1]CRI66868.1 hypothetical protein THIOKS13210010 [Thiocapsa sp. KS1]